MWTKTKSLFLSRILTISSAGLIFIISFFVPSIAKWYEGISIGEGIFSSQSIVIPMCISMYFCEVMAFMALWSLNILLGNISRGEVFISQNTNCLRKISWECMFVGIALFIFGLWRFVFIAGAFLAIMFGLVMRVLKNVFEKAVEIKSENDFTI